MDSLFDGIYEALKPSARLLPGGLRLSEQPRALIDPSVECGREGLD